MRATSISISLGAGLPASGETGAPRAVDSGCVSRVWGMVPPSKSRLCIRESCGRWGIFPNSQRSGSPFAPTLRDRDTVRLTVPVLRRRTLDQLGAYNGRRTIKAYLATVRMLLAHSG